MIITSQEAEQEMVLQTAKAMCAAARTAPKTKGADQIKTAIVTGGELELLAAEMERLSQEFHMGFMTRDAGNVRNSSAVVLIGCKSAVNGLGDACRFCGFENCADCASRGGRCAFNSIDLGIAVGSAVSVAADRRIDNRVMYSVGRAAMALKLLGEDAAQVLGIPLSVSGKTPYFDRNNPPAEGLPMKKPEKQVSFLLSGLFVLILQSHQFR